MSVQHRSKLSSFRHRCNLICAQPAVTSVYVLLGEAVKLLAEQDFVVQSSRMETNLASNHLQTIRTLMERSALYRRALAPVMIASGSVGLVASIVAPFARVESSRSFALYWLIVSVVAIAGAFLLVRRQALKDSESFWSVPTKRVTEALLPAFFVGFAAGAYHIFSDPQATVWLLALGWIIVYGCAIHAAGFFMQNRMRLFGWMFILGGCGVLFASASWPAIRTIQAAHYLMGGFFGVLHIACGIYLYFTETRRTA